MRISVALVLVLASLMPSVAQDDQVPWQSTVTGQIEAFRAEDGAAALALAGEGFREQFEGQPEAFYAAIVLSGYQPVVQSRSHSFGKFTRVSETVVAQAVLLVGPDQGLYEALYQLSNEPGEGWRVLGVALRKQPGIGI
ncbi:DUF4864 domain-containing protein [Devosia sp. BSSL-BM10]|uniref:DUF4864 domain-containing protein n=1 Tax=Devosia litorisediminis TaxID=2829817 RepID=A0A942I5C7_9HYPH|nr:DUF4864 domain-containing protein [Devosia litorisediminis]MBS3847762.1 DUF4864 domain-containing protein [Devosia litorisediminis]